MRQDVEPEMISTFSRELMRVAWKPTSDQAYVLIPRLSR